MVTTLLLMRFCLIVIDGYLSAQNLSSWIVGECSGEIRPENPVGIPMNCLAADSFTKGSPLVEKSRESNIGQVEVKLTEGFWLGQTEITHCQWPHLMETSNLPAKSNFCEGKNYAAANDPFDDLLEDAQANFGLITPSPPDELQKPVVVLGQHLFWDKRLSASGKIACASCHSAADWGADTEQFSIDAKGKPTKRNSQTVFNAMLQPNLRWTGDRKSGAHQAEKSLTGSMGFADADDVVELLKKHGYQPRFKEAFPATENPMIPAN